jgi:HlyD family secretion protein
MTANTTQIIRKRTPGAGIRRALPRAAVVLLLGLIIAGLWPRAAKVETARLASGPLRSVVEEEGKTRIRQKYTVAAPVSGRLRRIAFKAGAAIAANEVVAVIEPSSANLLDARSRASAEARRDSAAAQLERARAAHKFAASELGRNERLFREKTVSPQELEQAQWRETAAARDEAVAAAALREAEAGLADFSPDGVGSPAPVEVRSPIRGKVLKVYEESERTVGAGTPLAVVGDPRDLEVLVEVLSRDGAMMAAGTPVEFEQWGGPGLLLGVVRYVEPAAFTKTSALGVEEQRVNVVADLTTPPSARGNLGDGFRVEARIITWASARVLKAPNGAVFRSGADWAAYVVRDGHAHLTPVKVGHASGAEVEITGGLAEGDEVVLYPGERVHDGSRVTVMSLAPTTAGPLPAGAATGVMAPMNSQIHPARFEALIGTWSLESGIVGGAPFPPAVASTVRLVLTEGAYETSVAGQKDAGTVEFDVSADPKAMTITGVSGPNQGKVIPAIYEFDGMKLKICYNLGGSERPVKFESPAGSKLFLATYLRSTN